MSADSSPHPVSPRLTIPVYTYDEDCQRMIREFLEDLATVGLKVE